MERHDLPALVYLYSKVFSCFLKQTLNKAIVIGYNLFFMEFQKKFKKGIQKRTPERNRPSRLWTYSTVFSAVVFGIISLYTWLQSGSYTAFTANVAAANTAIILIGLSFALSGLCYFWDFVDSKIIYRKYIGIIGFAFAVAHGLFFYVRSVGDNLLNVGHFWGAFTSTPTRAVAFLTALVALVIFLLMTIISNRYSVNILGGKNWRRALRIGYGAYVLSIIHFSIKMWEEWGDWILSRDTILPPPSLIAVVIAVFVIVLRVALFVSLRKSNT